MMVNRDIYKRGRLTVRPKQANATADVTVGMQSLQLGGSREGFLYVPKGYRHDKPAALALMLHGAGGEADQGLSLLKDYADDRNILLLAPASRSYSWDIIAGEAFDLDVLYINQALEQVFDAYTIDPARIAIGGFSDGASYALCLGLSNGEVFSHVIAFSPGFVYTLEKHGAPDVFISHGVRDAVLPIDPCSRRIVPQLQRQGYPVHYHEFEGGHEIPVPVARSGVEWFLAIASNEEES